ncbi:MAG: hypothetical protein EBS54_08765 [Betaproteobacteria bacterium]|nr:hypothetical protein [Betaproteobacteria bacterium]NBP40579.1 hypothetical protein [Betaproteobacteria bacterium]NBQ79995.1 hypothetical protein [Betaproteobacteria bacterium]NBT06781.1 hypothetical protein [Betaproteobacteria bacterium]NBT82892.1 hypothetical protein [Betaproteobacteria bacterium]
MAKHFIIFVIDGSSASARPSEMESIDAFNDRLRTEGHWVFAGGLAAPSHSSLIDNRNNAGLSSNQSLFSDNEHYSGFWLISARDLEQAQELAFEGSKSCHRRVELRPLLP